MQTTVRSFYDIDGSDVQDWLDGCCCPCFTLSRNEEEIVLREKQNQKLKNLRESFLEESSPPSEYRSHVPMVYVSHDNHHHPALASPPRAKSANFSGKDVDDDIAALAPIPELSREVSSVGPAAEATVLQPIAEVPHTVPVPIKAGRHSPEHGAGHGGHGSGKRWPLMQYLGRRWYLVPADKKENEKPRSEDATLKETAEKITPRHSLDDDDRYATHAVSKHAAHGLEEHSKVGYDANKSRFKEHLLEDDTPSPARPLALGSPHRLATDPLVSRVHASKSHQLENDSSTSTPIPSTTPHQLESDYTAAKAAGFSSSHRLENDPLESTRPRGLWPSGTAKHDIARDENSAMGTKPTISHELHEDVPAGDPAKKTVSSHHLEVDEAQSKHGGAASHRLDDDMSVTARSTVVVDGSVQGHQKEETETAGHKLAKAASHLFSGVGK